MILLIRLTSCPVGLHVLNEVDTPGVGCIGGSLHVEFELVELDESNKLNLDFQKLYSNTIHIRIKNLYIWFDEKDSTKDINAAST